MESLWWDDGKFKVRKTRGESFSLLDTIGRRSCGCSANGLKRDVSGWENLSVYALTRVRGWFGECYDAFWVWKYWLVLRSARTSSFCRVTPFSLLHVLLLWVRWKWHSRLFLSALSFSLSPAWAVLKKEKEESLSLNTTVSQSKRTLANPSKFILPPLGSAFKMLKINSQRSAMYHSCGIEWLKVLALTSRLAGQ